MRNHCFEGATVWACHKGGNSQAEMERANNISAQQLAVQQQQLGLQQKQIEGVNSVLDPLIAQGGMTPQQQSALTSLAMNNIPQNFAQSRAAINQDLVARGMTGGPFAGSGGVANEFGQLSAMENQLKQQSLSNIELQKQQQLMQALGLKMGVGGMYGQNIGTYGNQGISALGIGQNAAQAADQAQNGFWGSLIGGLAGLGGTLVSPGGWLGKGKG